MGKLNRDNMRKTIFYLKKNGLKNTLLAVTERLQKTKTDSYTYVAPTESTIKEQQDKDWINPVKFSILVPLYHTPMEYFKEMVESLLAQTYPYFQLVLLDAGAKEEGIETGKGNRAKKTEYEIWLEQYGDSRIEYYPLNENKGIAENTNAGLVYATGEYIALLDHDDLLTPDALYEMATAVEAAQMKGIELQMIYSDEDKCDQAAQYFYEPHLKKDFDLELLLTNNYICHFTAIKTELFRKLKLRREFDGAQDFDLVLRVADECKNHRETIYHIPKILYHWRCHTSSTAANPQSKTYAYEAGKRAVEDFVKSQGWSAEVVHLKHLGFYRVVFKEDIFLQRPDLGAVGGSLVSRKGRIVGGLCDDTGKAVYEGLKFGFSGYMNRAALTQEASVLDLNCMKINPQCQAIVQKSLQDAGLTITDLKALQKEGMPVQSEIDIKQLSMKVSNDLKKSGYHLIWDPQWRKNIPN